MACSHVWCVRYVRGRNGLAVPRVECLRCEALPTVRTVPIRSVKPAPTGAPGPGRPQNA